MFCCVDNNQQFKCSFNGKDWLNVPIVHTIFKQIEEIYYKDGYIYIITIDSMINHELFIMDTDKLYNLCSLLTELRIE